MKQGTVESQRIQQTAAVQKKKAAADEGAAFQKKCVFFPPFSVCGFPPGTAVGKPTRAGF